MAGAEPTRVLMGVNESTIKGYPHASISSRKAFEWTLEKIVRSNTSGLDDMDNIYASPKDFKTLKRRDQARGAHLLEFFVERCHAIGVACEAWIKTVLILLKEELQM